MCRGVGRASISRQIVTTSALKPSSNIYFQTCCMNSILKTPLRKNSSSSRRHQVNRHLATSNQKAAEYNMSSDNAQSHNNDDFQLGNLFNVKDRVALITGAGSGIGLMATQALAVNGAKVYICGRTEEKYARSWPLINIATDSSITGLRLWLRRSTKAFQGRSFLSLQM